METTTKSAQDEDSNRIEAQSCWILQEAMTIGENPQIMAIYIIMIWLNNNNSNSM